MKEQLEKFCRTYQLGEKIKEAHPISGGLLHKMYRVETNRGVYAIKILNSDIMKRPEALRNTINSEKVSHALAEVVPLVAAKEFGGTYVVEFDGTWCMAFDWLEGASVYAPDITEQHCAQMGQALGKIHAANVKIDGMEAEPECRKVFNWKELLEKLEQAEQAKEVMENVPISCYEALNAYLPELLNLDAEAVKALHRLAAHQVLSHRDLDPKNVMWQGEQPYLIDWEAAGYVNPYQELVEVLNYWITDVNGAYDYRKFTALICEYAKSIEIASVDWDTVLNASFDGMLGWLEYNVKRAAGLEGSDIKEREAGKQQVLGTIAEIKRQKVQLEQLKNWLSEWRLL